MARIALWVAGALVLLTCFWRVAPAEAQAVEVGTTQTYWTLDYASSQYRLISATAKYAGEHVVILTDDRDAVSPAIIDELGQAFDSVIYPTLTAAYGSEPNPGIDGDPRVFVVIYDFDDPLRDVNGAFYAGDIQPDGAHSNHREMFYLNLQALLADVDSGPALAAHEFAHLIIQYRDVMLDPSPDASPESTWLVEGLTTYAEHLCGYDDEPNDKLESFYRNPDFDLAYWTGVSASYGASYSFISYLAQREGSDFIRSLVGQPLDGITGIDATLQSMGSADTFSSLFDDWVISGFLDSRGPSEAPYLFDNLNVSITPDSVSGTPPLLGTDEVVNYGAEYLDFPESSTAVSFQAVVDGADNTPLQAALISWDSTGVLAPSVDRLDLGNSATGGTATGPVGYDRHTLVVWARGIVGSNESYSFTYSGTTDPPAGIQFLDMGGNDPFYRYVKPLLAQGIVSGKQIPDGSGLWFFKGADQVTRAQFAKMIMLATGLHTLGVDNADDPTFTDVRQWDTNGYPYDYVEEAVNARIVTGFSDGTFRPYSPITRAQLVLMITRGAAAIPRPLTEYTGNATIFVDVPPSHPYYREIMTAYVAGILSGSVGPDGRMYFYPYASATRNQVAKMTANLVALLQTP